jgi:hypothetical protein
MDLIGKGETRMWRMQKGERGRKKSRRRRKIVRRMKIRKRRSKCCHDEHKEMYQAYGCG